MSYSPIEQAEQLRVGTIDFVSPNEIKATLDIEAPDSVALNAGTPRNFPRVNSYVLIRCDNGYLVGQVEWLAVERSAYPKRKGLQDFGLIDLPFPLRRLSLNPIGTLKRVSENGKDNYKFQRGVESFPSIGDSVILPTDHQLKSIIESGDNRRIIIGQSPLASNANVAVDPDRLFGRHIAVIGNTGSGKSCSVAGMIQWSIEAAMDNCVQPNARFIVLDPNGEYSRAFGADTKFKGRIFKVDAEQNEHQLKVPSWFWNSSEWASFTKASTKVQLPLLKRSLRAMRNEEFELQENLDLEIKKYLGTILFSIKSDKTKGSAWGNFPAPKNLFEKIDSWRQSIDTYKSKLESTDDRLIELANNLQTYCVNRAGQYPNYNATVDEIPLWQDSCRMKQKVL